jgi:hypothetical protein
MARLALAVIGAVIALAPSPARTAEEKCIPRCEELPAMERELFDQEYLQKRFQEYLEMNVVPNPEMVEDSDSKGGKRLESMIEAMARDAAQALTRDSQSPAGGGRKGQAAPGAGTSAECKLFVYVKGKPKPLEEKKFRGERPCWDAEFVLTHEGQHVEDCKSGVKILDVYELYAASDVRAYGAGIRKLRELIAQTAGSCGWKGSTNKTKANPVDKKDEMVVPTPADVAEIVNALKTNASAARRGRR